MVSHQAKPFWRSGIGVLCLWIAVVTQAEPLSLKAELAVRAATFEVVMRKPEADPLTYEKPLPMELIPYAIRSDAFLSVGTAFKIGANQFVSAAHVLNAGVGTQYGQPALRDKLGKVYLIDQVLKYSMDEDFVVFSVAGPSNSKPLATNSAPTINRFI